MYAVRQLQLLTRCQQVDIGSKPAALQDEHFCAPGKRSALNPQPRGDSGAEAEVQAVAAVLHRGLGSPSEPIPQSTAIRDGPHRGGDTVIGTLT